MAFGRKKNSQPQAVDPSAPPPPVESDLSPRPPAPSSPAASIAVTILPGVPLPVWASRMPLSNQLLNVQNNVASGGAFTDTPRPAGSTPQWQSEEIGISPESPRTELTPGWVAEPAKLELREVPTWQDESGPAASSPPIAWQAEPTPPQQKPPAMFDEDRGQPAFDEAAAGPAGQAPGGLETPTPDPHLTPTPSWEDADIAPHWQAEFADPRQVTATSEAAASEAAASAAAAAESYDAGPAAEVAPAQSEQPVSASGRSAAAEPNRATSAEAIHSQPDRIVGVGTLPPPTPSHRLDQLPAPSTTARSEQPRGHIVYGPGTSPQTIASALQQASAYPYVSEDSYEPGPVRSSPAQHSPFSEPSPAASADDGDGPQPPSDDPDPGGATDEPIVRPSGGSPAASGGGAGAPADGVQANAAGPTVLSTSPPSASQGAPTPPQAPSSHAHPRLGTSDLGDTMCALAEDEDATEADTVIDLRTSTAQPHLARVVIAGDAESALLLDPARTSQTPPIGSRDVDRPTASSLNPTSGPLPVTDPILFAGPDAASPKPTPTSATKAPIPKIGSWILGGLVLGGVGVAGTILFVSPGLLITSQAPPPSNAIATPESVAGLQSAATPKKAIVPALVAGVSAPTVATYAGKDTGATVWLTPNGGSLPTDLFAAYTAAGGNKTAEPQSFTPGPRGGELQCGAVNATKSVCFWTTGGIIGGAEITGMNRTAAAGLVADMRTDLEPR